MLEDMNQLKFDVEDLMNKVATMSATPGNLLFLIIQNTFDPFIPGLWDSVVLFNLSEKNWKGGKINRSYQHNNRYCQ